MDDRFAGLLARFEATATQPWEVLAVPSDELARRVRISVREIESFRAYYAGECVDRPLTSIDTSLIRTEIPDLDRLLGGGIRRGAISEISGAAGMGKTCFCCQMALCADSAVYIATEDNIRVVQRRMQQLVPRFRDMRSVRFVAVRTPAELRIAAHKMRALDPVPQLVVVDSVTMLARHGTGHLDGAELDDTLGLRRLAAHSGCAILVANQVRDRVAPEDRAPGPAYEFDQQQEHMEGDPRLRPALGPQWAARLDTRLFLRQARRSAAEREMLLVFSKWAPYGSVAMQMTESGLRVGPGEAATPGQSASQPLPAPPPPPERDASRTAVT